MENCELSSNKIFISRAFKQSERAEEEKRTPDKKANTRKELHSTIATQQMKLICSSRRQRAPKSK